MLFVRSLAAIACSLGIVRAQGPVREYSQLLRRLVDVDWLWQAPMPGERCVQFSSFDRASLKGPGDANAWYANNDRGQHLRVVEKDGAKEFVMVDAKGPGCVARIWSANPQGTLHFDVDGARVWSVDFAALCSGKVDGVPEWLAGMRSKGGNCYLPIPFRDGLVVSCTAGDCYYAFDVVPWAEGTRMPSFSPELLRKHDDDLRALAAALLAAAPPTAQSFAIGSVDPRGTVRREEAATVPLTAFEGRISTDADTTMTRAQLPRGAVVEWLELAVPKGEPTAELLRVLRRTCLRVSMSDERLVDVPVTDFFATGPDWVAWGGRMLGVDQQGRAWSRWPMPLREGGIVELVTEGARPVELTLRGMYSEQRLPLDALVFRASYHVVKGTPTRPFGDHLVLDAKGRGRFVGCSLLVRNPSRVWWGEGDEKLTVDGEAFPSWFGTGTEDYFGYAWCDPTPFSALFHAQVECQGPQNFGITQLHRTHLLDAVPFQQSLRFELERWHWIEDVAIDYATVAYWYGARGATSGLPPVPNAAARTIERPAPPAVFVAEGVIEGEDLRVVACPSGTHAMQELWFVEKTFSKDRVLCWREGKVGDTFTVAMPVPAAGRYKLTAAFCQADDFGIVQVSLGGQALGAPFDGFAERPRSTGPRELGTVDLPAGDAELRFQLTGKNENAKPHFVLGLDYVRLERQQ